MLTELNTKQSLQSTVLCEQQEKIDSQTNEVLWYLIVVFDLMTMIVQCNGLFIL